MPSVSFERYLPRLLTIARSAGEEICRIYNGTISVELKEDRSPLTEADKAAHRVIAAELAALAFSPEPGGPSTVLPVLSEEGRSMPYAERRGWEYFWLVDPLDGTKEFIKRNGEFTVNIALIHRGRPVLGVIAIPVTGLFYFAALGFGSYSMNGNAAPDAIGAGAENDMKTMVEHSQRLPLRSRNRHPGSLVIAGSRSHATPELENFVSAMKKEHGEVDFVSAGSSLKFCLVAEGKADLYPRLAPTMEWDTAAGQIIVEEAGGTVLRTDDGNPLAYNKEQLLNPWFIARAGK